MTTTTAELDEAIGKALILLLVAVTSVLLFGHLIVEHLELLTKIGVVVAVLTVVLHVGGQRLE